MKLLSCIQISNWFFSWPLSKTITNLNRKFCFAWKYFLSILAVVRLCDTQLKVITIESGRQILLQSHLFLDSCSLRCHMFWSSLVRWSNKNSFICDWTMLAKYLAYHTYWRSKPWENIANYSRKRFRPSRPNFKAKRFWSCEWSLARGYPHSPGLGQTLASLAFYLCFGLFFDFIIDLHLVGLWHLLSSKQEKTFFFN